MCKGVVHAGSSCRRYEKTSFMKRLRSPVSLFSGGTGNTTLEVRRRGLFQLAVPCAGPQEATQKQAWLQRRRDAQRIRRGERGLPAVRGVGTIAYAGAGYSPPPVFLSWQALHSACQLASSQNSCSSPRCGTMWSITVAGVSRFSRRHSAQRGCFFRKSDRALRQRPSYPRCVAVSRA